MENSSKPSRFKIKKFKSFPTFSNPSVKYKSSFRSLNLSHDNQYGVRNIIATKAIWSPKSKFMLGICIALASFFFNLDNGTNVTISSAAASSFQKAHSLNAINATTAILLAVGKPFFGKLMNVIGRSESFAICLFFMSFGYLVCAVTPNITGLGAGMCLWQIGFSGFQIVLQVVIADVTNLRYRSFFSVLANSGWFFILFYANGEISRLITKDGLGWRWGYGLYAICYVPAVLPIIIILFWAQNRAKKLGYVGDDPILLQYPKPTFQNKIKKFLSDVDIIGLYLLFASLVYLFLPIILAGQVKFISWHSATVPTMMIAGFFVFIPAFVYWEAHCALHPVLPVRFLKNQTIFIVCIINFFDFMSFYLSYSQLFYFIQVATDWSTKNINYYVYTQALCMTFFAILWSIIAFVFQIRWRSSVTSALVVRLIGVGLMLHARNHPTTVSLIMTQVLQGAGGGIVAAATQVGAQGAVPHQDLALATAAVLLFAEIGNVVGQSVASAINVTKLPLKIAEMFPNFTSEQIQSFVGEPSKARTLGLIGSPARDKMVQAFSNNMRLLTIPATVIAAIPIIASKFMQDFQLDQRKNIVESTESLVANHSAVASNYNATRSTSPTGSDVGDRSNEGTDNEESDLIGDNLRHEDQHQKGRSTIAPFN